MCPVASIHMHIVFEAINRYITEYYNESLGTVLNDAGARTWLDAQATIGYYICLGKFISITIKLLLNRPGWTVDRLGQTCTGITVLILCLQLVWNFVLSIGTLRRYILCQIYSFFIKKTLPHPHYVLLLIRVCFHKHLNWTRKRPDQI